MDKCEKWLFFALKKRENSHSIPAGVIFFGSSLLDDALFLRVACGFGLYSLRNFIAYNVKYCAIYAILLFWCKIKGSHFQAALKGFYA